MDRQHRPAGEAVGEGVPGIQQRGKLRRRAPPFHPTPAKLARHLVAGPSAEHHRQNKKASTARK